MDRERSEARLTRPRTPPSDIIRGGPIPSVRKRLSATARGLLDTLLPPQCPITGEIVDRPGSLSGTGWAQLQFIVSPHCRCCGLPFPYDASGEGKPLLCGACATKPPAYDAARAALIYDDVSSQLILRFKYGDRTDGIAQMCRWMVDAGRDVWSDCDCLLPVPLHYGRLVSRRFNQAALLAEGLSGLVNIKTDSLLLKRRRATPQQKGLGYQARRRNVQGAFTIPDKARDGIQGRHFAVIDDVLTTGATVEACARLLKRHGAQKVSVVTVARVVSEQKIPI